jgi:exoribonuclease R
MVRGKPGAVYRVHERPDVEDMERLGERLAAVGMQVDPTPENLGTIAQKAKSDAVNYLILRSVPRAYYSPAALGTSGSRWRTTRTLPPRSGATPTCSSTVPFWARSRRTM